MLKFYNLDKGCKIRFVAVVIYAVKIFNKERRNYQSKWGAVYDNSHPSLGYFRAKSVRPLGCSNRGKNGFLVTLQKKSADKKPLK